MAPVTESVAAGGIATELRRAGRGTPLLVIHGELGLPFWPESLESLAEHYEVIVPSLPGYGRSERPDWIMGVRDLAAWVTWCMRDLTLDQPLNVIGCSLGGWIAAEIACVAPQFFNKLVLVGAMGLKPEKGDIFDYFIESGAEGIRRNFYCPDDSPGYRQYWGREWTAADADLVEQHREMTCRVAWKPYMHSLTLPRLLAGVRTPTLVVWGREDRVAPLVCGEQYTRAIPNARIATIPACGHMPELERPEQFADVVREFVGA